MGVKVGIFWWLSIGAWAYMAWVGAVTGSLATFIARTWGTKIFSVENEDIKEEKYWKKDYGKSIMLFYEAV